MSDKHALLDSSLKDGKSLADAEGIPLLTARGRFSVGEFDFFELTEEGNVCPSDDEEDTDTPVVPTGLNIDELLEDIGVVNECGA